MPHIVEHHPEEMFCSFCGKPHDEVRRLIEGGCSRARLGLGTCVFICDECVELCAQINASASAVVQEAG